MPLPFNRSLAGDSLIIVFGDTSSISPITSRTLTGVRGRSSELVSLASVEPLALPGDMPGASVVALRANSLTLPGEAPPGLPSVLTSPEERRPWCLDRDCLMREYCVHLVSRIVLQRLEQHNRVLVVSASC